MNKPHVKKLVEDVIFNIKWVLPLFYLALVVVLGQTGYVFLLEVWRMVLNVPSTVEQMKIVALDFADTVMIANLIKMIITGSYNSFICKDHGHANERISSGMLKIKIMTSIIIVSGMGLLRDYVTDSLEPAISTKHLTIFIVFLIGAIALSVIEYLHLLGERIEHDLHKETKHDSHD